MVGIGTTSPRAPLEVNGHAIIDNAYIVINNNPSVANFFFGNDDGYDITSGAGNMGIGLHALQLLQDGINNTAIGWDSQMFNITGDNNTSVGEDALKNVIGNGNTALGYTSGYSITSGTQNTSMSPLSLYNLTTGSYNVALGHNAGNGLQTNSSNNVLVGYGTFNSTATANNNTAVGYGAGYYSTGSSNVFLGYSAGLNETNSNRLYIDNKGGSASTALIYGVFDASIANQSVTVNGRLGIATTSPVSRLALDADSATTGITLTDFSGSGPNRVIDAYTPNSTLGGYFITNPNTYSAHFGLSGDTAQIGSTNATPVQLVTNGVARVYLNTTGNVGISSTTPWRTFSVNGTVALNGLTSSATG
ncbi:MAG: hypothetical protein KBD05_00780, partial [Candidatus Pacebacteria bacterium]|nr:hypothetical protein [Candidatus Paceibacterota bacterium]